MKTYEPNIDNKTKRFVKKYDDGYGARNSTLTVSISEDLKNEVRALAKKENKSLSNMVNIILLDHLKGGEKSPVPNKGEALPLTCRNKIGQVVANANIEFIKVEATYRKNQPIARKYQTDEFEARRLSE